MFLNFRVLSSGPAPIREQLMIVPSLSRSLADSLEDPFTTSLSAPLPGGAILRAEIALASEGGRFRTLSRVRLSDARTFHVSTRLLPDGSFEHTGYCGERALPVLRSTAPEWRFSCPEGAREGLGPEAAGGTAPR